MNEFHIHKSQAKSIKEIEEGCSVRYRGTRAPRRSIPGNLAPIAREHLDISSATRVSNRGGDIRSVIDGAGRVPAPREIPPEIAPSTYILLTLLATHQVQHGVDDLPVGHLSHLDQTDQHGEFEAVVHRHRHHLLGPLDITERRAL